MKCKKNANLGIKLNNLVACHVVISDWSKMYLIFFLKRKKKNIFLGELGLRVEGVLCPLNRKSRII